MSEKSIKVVHLSQTPLVAAPFKLAVAQRMIGIDAKSVVINDYPKNGPLAKKFLGDSLVWADAEDSIIYLIKTYLLQADIIHIHNDISGEVLNFVKEYCSKANFVYQVHSPLREGPLYHYRHESIGLPFGAFLVVSQYQPRHYYDYQPVPNIILDAPSVSLRKPGEALKVLFSPSHTRSGRWNAKYSERLEECIKNLQGLGLIEAVWPKQPLSPTELMAVRKLCHVSIDEISTGAYHQVSLEGLCAGNVVINRADYFSKAMLANCNNGQSMPPFVFADDATIDNVLIKLAMSQELTAELQKASFDYFKDNLEPKKMAKIYKGIYDALA